MHQVFNPLERARSGNFLANVLFVSQSPDRDL